MANTNLGNAKAVKRNTFSKKQFFFLEVSYNYINFVDKNSITFNFKSVMKIFPRIKPI